MQPVDNGATSVGVDAMSNGDPRLELRKKAIDIAIEWTKQITTLATGTLVLSGTFIKDLFTGHVEWSIVIIVSWMAMSLSALFGILYVGALIAVVSTAGNAADLDVNKNRNGRTVARIHIVAFMVGLVTFVTFITKNML
jgi:hypothetical protein